MTPMMHRERTARLRRIAESIAQDLNPGEQRVVLALVDVMGTERTSASALPDPTQTPLMTAAQVADLLGKSRGTVDRAIRAGDLPSVTVGGRRYVPTGRLRVTLGVDPA